MASGRKVGVEKLMENLTTEPWTVPFTHKFVPVAANGVTLLLLHGTGGNENSLLELGAELLPEANLLSPRGKVLENGMPRFFRRLSEGVFDVEDLHTRTVELARFIREATNHYGLNPGKLVALGYSNGANIASSLLLTYSNLIAGAVLLRAMVPFEPSEPISGSRSQVLLLSGDRDPLVPIHDANRLAQLLKETGAKVTHTTVHAGHSLTEPELNTAHDFLECLATRL